MAKNYLTKDQKKYFEEQLNILSGRIYDLRTKGKKIQIPLSEIKDCFIAWVDKIEAPYPVLVSYSKNYYRHAPGMQPYIDLSNTPTYKKALEEIQSEAGPKLLAELDALEETISNFKLKLIFGNKPSALLTELNNLAKLIEGLEKEI